MDIGNSQSLAQTQKILSLGLSPAESYSGKRGQGRKTEQSRSRRLISGLSAELKSPIVDSVVRASAGMMSPDVDVLL